LKERPRTGEIHPGYTRKGILFKKAFVKLFLAFLGWESWNKSRVVFNGRINLRTFHE